MARQERIDGTYMERGEQMMNLVRYQQDAEQVRLTKWERGKSQVAECRLIEVVNLCYKNWWGQA